MRNDAPFQTFYNLVKTCDKVHNKGLPRPLLHRVFVLTNVCTNSLLAERGKEVVSPSREDAQCDGSCFVQLVKPSTRSRKS